MPINIRMNSFFPRYGTNMLSNAVDLLWDSYHKKNQSSRRFYSINAQKGTQVAYPVTGTISECSNLKHRIRVVDFVTKPLFIYQKSYLSLHCQMDVGFLGIPSAMSNRIDVEPLVEDEINCRINAIKGGRDSVYPDFFLRTLPDKLRVAMIHRFGICVFNYSYRYVKTRE